MMEKLTLNNYNVWLTSTYFYTSLFVREEKERKINYVLILIE